jgi:hypothetical protein
MVDKYGAFGGIRIGGGKSTLKKLPKFHFAPHNFHKT